MRRVTHMGLWEEKSFPCAVADNRRINLSVTDRTKDILSIKAWHLICHQKSLDRMKRSGFFVFFSIITHCLCAQIQFGVKAGLNVSDVVINNSFDPNVEPGFQMKAGLHAGFFLSTEVDEKFGFAAELLYSNKGVKAFETVNLHYFAVPLLLRYHFHEKFFAEVGPEVSYLIS